MLFLKTAHEQTLPPYNRAPIVPAKLDRSLEDSDHLPEPEVLAQEIIDDLENALAQLRGVASELR